MWIQNWNFGRNSIRVSRFEEKSRVRVEEATTGHTAQTRPRNERVRIREDVPSYWLFLAGASATLASKLSIEAIQRTFLRCQFILVSFYCFLRELWIERFKVHRRNLLVGGVLCLDR
jgi:hypothetical protein